MLGILSDTSPLATHCTECTQNHWSCQARNRAPQKASSFAAYLAKELCQMIYTYLRPLFSESKWCFRSWPSAFCYFRASNPSPCCSWVLDFLSVECPTAGWAEFTPFAFRRPHSSTRRFLIGHLLVIYVIRIYPYTIRRPLSDTGGWRAGGVCFQSIYHPSIYISIYWGFYTLSLSMRVWRFATACMARAWDCYITFWGGYV